MGILDLFRNAYTDSTLVVDVRNPDRTSITVGDNVWHPHGIGLGFQSTDEREVYIAHRRREDVLWRLRNLLIAWNQALQLAGLELIDPIAVDRDGNRLPDIESVCSCLNDDQPNIDFPEQDSYKRWRTLTLSIALPVQH